MIKKLWYNRKEKVRVLRRLKEDLGLFLWICGFGVVLCIVLELLPLL